VQFVALKVPLPLLAKLTLPVGVLAMPASMSLTVAVQVVETPSSTELGVQLTEVEVLRLFTVKVPLPLVLSLAFTVFVAVTVKVVVPAGVALLVVMVKADVFELSVDENETQLGVAPQEVEKEPLAPVGNPVTVNAALNAPLDPPPVARVMVTT
jgi:hypothetical protein